MNLLPGWPRGRSKIQWELYLRLVPSEGQVTVTEYRKLYYP